MSVPTELASALAAKCEAMRIEGASRAELSRHVALALAQQGIRPSVQIVRGITNLGSNDAIAKDIKGVLEEVGRVMQRRGMKSLVPESVMVVAEDLIDKIWTAAVDQARNEFDAERADVYKVRDQAIQDMAIVNGQLDAALKDKDAALFLVEAERKAKDQAHDQIARLETRIQEADETRARMEQDLQHERAERARESEQFSRDLEATHSAHKRELDVADGNRKYVMLQLDTARGSERELAERLKSLQQDKERQDQQNRIEINNLRDKAGELRQAIGQLEGQLTAKNSEISRATSRIDELQQHLVSQAAEVEAKNALVLQEQQALVEKSLTQAKNSPHVFEFCEEREHEVLCLFDIHTDSIQFWLATDTGERAAGPFMSVKELNIFCAEELGKEDKQR